MLRKRLGISHLLQGLSVPLLPLQLLLLLLLWLLSLHPKHLQQLLVHLVTSLLHFLATLRHTLDSCHPVYSHTELQQTPAHTLCLVTYLSR